MPKRLFTQEHIDYLAINADGRTLQELTDVFNKHFDLHMSMSQVCGPVYRHKIHKPTGRKPLQFLTSEQVNYLRNNVAEYSRRKLTEMFNAHFRLQKTESQIKNALYYHNIRSGYHFYTTEQVLFLEQNVVGRSSQELTDMFNKHFDLNLSITQIMAAKSSRKLKSGIKNVSPVGTETLLSSGHIMVKVADPSEWKKKHVLIWEATNGPVPEGFTVIFADGDPLNLDLDNLLLVPRKVVALLALKGLLHKNSELTKAGINVANIILKISERREQAYSRIHNGRVCRRCGKKYDDDEFTIYCSRECRDNAYETLKDQGMGIDRSLYQHCVVCEKPIEQGTGKIKKYCSRACQRIRDKHRSSLGGSANE